MQQEKDISKLIKQGEGLHIDFKHSISDAKKIARSLVAFANTEGGSLLIGVRDNGSIVGVKTEEEYYMIETAAILYCKPEVKFEVRNHTVNTKPVLEIMVKKSENVPHYAPDTENNPKAYVRVADQNIVAPKTLIDVWKRKKSGIKGVKLVFNDTVELLFNEITENQTVTKSQFIRIAGIKSSQADRILSNLMLMEILDIVITEKSIKYCFKKDYEGKS